MFKKTIITVTAVMLVFSFVLQAEQDTSKKVIRLVTKANELLRSQDFEKVQERLEKAKEIDENYAPIYETYGKIALMQKKDSEAIEYYEKAVSLDPDYKPAIRFYSQLLVRRAQGIMRRDPQKAIEIFKKVLDLKHLDEILPKMKSQLIFTLGQLHQQVKKFEESNQYYQQFLSIPEVETKFPTFYTPAYFSIGINYTQLKEYEKANKNLKKYLEMSTEVTEQNRPLLANANYLIGSNNFQLVEEKCTEIQEDESIKENKVKNEKMAELAKSHREDIIPYLEKSLELKPDLEDSYKFLGNYYSRALQLDKAIDSFETLIEKFPESNYLTSYKAILNKIKKKKEESKEEK